MYLIKCKINKDYYIDDINNLNKSLKRRIEILGLIKHTKVRVLNKNKSAMIICFRGNRFAVSNLICEKIKVVV